MMILYKFGEPTNPWDPGWSIKLSSMEYFKLALEYELNYMSSIDEETRKFWGNCLHIALIHLQTSKFS